MNWLKRKIEYCINGLGGLSPMPTSKRWFHRRPKKSYSHKDGDDLTEYEVDLIRQTATTTLKCPDCSVGILLRGPSGGCSVNVKCSNQVCGSRFNLAHGLIFAERISNKSPLA